MMAIKLRLVLFSILLLQCSLRAQQLEVFAGGGVNHFYDRGYDDGHYLSEYKAGPTIGAGVGLFGKTGLGFVVGFTMKYLEINGEIDLQGGGLGFGTNLQAQTKIRSLEFGLFPLNLRLLKEKLELQLGLEIGIPFDTQIKGETNDWYLDQDLSTMPPKIVTVNVTNTISTNSKEYFTDMSSTACLRAGYVLRRGQKFEFIPRLYFGYGLGKKFTDKIDSKPKNFVFLAELGVRRNF